MTTNYDAYVSAKRKRATGFQMVLAGAAFAGLMVWAGVRDVPVLMAGAAAILVGAVWAGHGLWRVHELGKLAAHDPVDVDRRADANLTEAVLTAAALAVLSGLMVADIIDSAIPAVAGAVVALGAVLGRACLPSLTAIRDRR